VTQSAASKTPAKASAKTPGKTAGKTPSNTLGRTTRQGPKAGYARGTGASIEERKTRRGTSYRLRYRYQGRSIGETFTSRKQAEEWKLRFNVLGVEEAHKMLTAALAAVEGPQSTESTEPTAPRVMTVRELVEEYLEHMNGDEGYRDESRSQAQRHICDVVVTVDTTKLEGGLINPEGRRYQIRLGDLTVDLLSEKVCASWLATMKTTKTAGRGARRPLSPKTIKNRHSLLSQMLSYAVSQRYVERNYAYGMKLPQLVKRRHVYVSLEGQRTIIESIDQRYRDLVIMLLGTGMRWSEITALRVEKVVRTESGYQILIDEAWKNVKTGSMKLGAPKTKKGQRDIPVPRANTELHAALRRALHGKRLGDLVFPSPEGYQLRNAEFHDAVWQPMKRQLVASGWQEMFPTIHDLRHTFASMAIRNGVDILTLANLLGHEKTATTLDTYGHLFGNAKDSAMASMGSVMTAVLTAEPMALVEGEAPEVEDDVVELNAEGEPMVYEDEEDA